LDGILNAVGLGIDQATSQSDPSLGGQSLQDYATNDYNSTLSSSDFTIPYEDAGQMLDMGGSFITPQTDGSANAYQGADSLDTQGNYYAGQLDSSAFDAQAQDMGSNQSVYDNIDTGGYSGD
jgi:hypothetical protein